MESLVFQERGRAAAKDLARAEVHSEGIHLRPNGFEKSSRGNGPDRYGAEEERSRPEAIARLRILRRVRRLDALEGT